MASNEASKATMSGVYYYYFTLILSKNFRIINKNQNYFTRNPLKINIYYYLYTITLYKSPDDINLQDI
jgi:hypothetical protein